MTNEPRRPLRWWGVGMDLLVGAAVLWLMWSLLGEWANAYIRWEQPAVEPDASVVMRYWTIAGIIFALLLLGFVIAVLQRRTPALVAYPIVFVVVIGTVLLFAVPQIDWKGQDPVYPRNPNGCYRTDSENCPGG